MNFTYLSSFPRLKKLYEYCCEAEDFALKKPNISATSARKGMEFIVKMIYTALVGESGVSVFEMVSDARFIACVHDEGMLNSIHFIRKLGNVAVHQGDLSCKDALEVLRELHFLVGEFCIQARLTDDYPEFTEPTMPVAPKPIAESEKTVTVDPELVVLFAKRMRSTRFDVKFKRDEEENKKLFLKASLRESGWAMVNRNDTAMPCAAGLNILLDDGDTVDYILYGRDNRPLAIIEYTTTAKNLVEGRMKAIDKANKLAVKLGYKPVVYYTNGYHIYVIDQLGYKPRRVFQFHTIEELELLKLRATMRQDISNPVIDASIAGRPYQQSAIAGACGAFMQLRRHALLVMATGTGKTRTAIALSDVLLKAGWAKNILFLADRTSLVRQAHKNFTKLLPSVTTSVYSGGSLSRDPNARIIFSTYQTMINLINDDTREFSIGRFDLIIIDEAHRSIFKKYSALFRYFDALMLGLTATPRAEDNKSTYQMFDLPDGQPDFAYELEQAIQEGYLVGFSVLDKTTDALRRGLHYDELSPEEKERFEDTFASGEEEDMPADYSGTVIDADKMRSAKYINLGTIDAMLNDLLKNGLKINGGDKLGKTIIFASSHFEAEKIVERFQKLYGYLGLDFCKLIDSQIVNNLGLIDSFGERDQLPQVAVSVDMMDTGIDVPDVLNLVFFKKVQSKIKFLQMIGRGTRLSANIFGPGMHKQGFLIFDYYDNFDYFRTRNTWSAVAPEIGGKTLNSTPQSELINRRRLGILQTLLEKRTRTAFEEQYMHQLKTYFVDAMQGLCNDDIQVQYNMAYVSKYRTAELWDGFTPEKIEEIQKRILPLLPPESDVVKVKTFDLMMLVLEDEVPKRMEAAQDIRKIRHGFGNIGDKIDAMLVALEKLKTIPAIVQKEQLIKQMRHADLIFDRFSLELCERVRLELRNLMQYIPDDSRYYVFDVQDFVIDTDATASGITREKSYAEKAQDYIEQGSPALAKIRNLDELTQEEKGELEAVFKEQLGSVAEYTAWSGNRPLLPYLRVQVGIAEDAIRTKFGAFLNEDVLDADQLEYLRQIIDYAKENGDIVFLDLQQVSPFCDIDVMSLFGDKITYIKTLIQGLHKPVM